MRLPHGILTELEKHSGIAANLLSEYAAARIRPGGKRALLLEQSCKKIGLDVSIRLWLYGRSDEIKAALTANQIKPSAQPVKNNRFIKNIFSRFFSKTTRARTRGASWQNK